MSKRSLWDDETIIYATIHTERMNGRKPWRSISTEGYAQLMCEMDRLSAQLEQSKRRMFKLTTEPTREGDGG